MLLPKISICGLMDFKGRLIIIHGHEVQPAFKIFSYR